MMFPVVTFLLMVSIFVIWTYDGYEAIVRDSIVMTRFHQGFDKESKVEKGKVYKLEVSPMSTSNYFAKGHQMRIEISSSNFPRFARNLNTGGNNFDESKGVVATNRIHQSAAHPSQIRLPIVSKKSAPSGSEEKE